MINIPEYFHEPFLSCCPAGRQARHAKLLAAGGLYYAEMNEGHSVALIKLRNLLDENGYEHIDIDEQGAIIFDETPKPFIDVRILDQISPNVRQKIADLWDQLP